MAYDAQNSPVIGIDLGTAYSSIARWTGTQAEVYSPKGERSIRSVVYYDEKSNKYVYGNTAFKGWGFQQNSYYEQYNRPGVWRK